MLEKYMHTIWSFRNVTQTLQRLMDNVLGATDYVYCFDSINQHEEHLRNVLQIVLCVNVDKCQHCKSEVRFLSYIINQIKTSHNEVRCREDRTLNLQKSCYHILWRAIIVNSIN